LTILRPIPYQAPSWLPGGHAQTIWPLTCKGPLPPYRRTREETPDGDFIDIDWIAPPHSQNQLAAPHGGADAFLGRPGEGIDPQITGVPSALPMVVLFHGLEGSSRSHYARSLMRAVARHGWCGAVVHFRGCSGEPNRLPRAYHSGDSAEINWVLHRLHAARPQAPLYVAGVSLGGNALLKWLGEQGTAAQFVSAAAAISAPLDLAAANAALLQGFSRIYARHFLRTLIPAALAKLERFPGLYDAARVRAANSMHSFDEVVTAPLHGFTSADDYYRRVSSHQFLGGITVPTLVLNARNDPFLPASALPGPAEAPPAVILEQPEQGGHVGFVADTFPGSLDWLPERLMAHFAACSSMPPASDRQ
jgi:hypothetical protein